jgi:hypothetical protein
MAKRSPNDAYISYRTRHKKPNKFTAKRPLMTLEEFNESRKNGKKGSDGRHLHEFSQEGTRIPFLWHYGSIGEMQAQITKLKKIGSSRSLRRADMLQVIVDEFKDLMA